MTFDKETMLDELIRLTKPPSREDLPKPNITAAEYAKREECNHDLALKRLKRAEARGLLGSKLILVDGHVARVFWRK